MSEQTGKFFNFTHKDQAGTVFSAFYELDSSEARALATQIIAACDYAEGVES